MVPTEPKPTPDDAIWVMELNSEPSMGTSMVGMKVESESTARAANHCSSILCVVIDPRYAAPVTITRLEKIGTTDIPNNVSSNLLVTPWNQGINDKIRITGRPVIRTAVSTWRIVPNMYVINAAMSAISEPMNPSSVDFILSENIVPRSFPPLVIWTRPDTTELSIVAGLSWVMPPCISVKT